MAAHELSAVGLRTGAPMLGMPGLTEIRMIPRPFPKGNGERECYKFLATEMRAAPDQPRGTKAEFEKKCRRRFHVTVASFEYCWREAIKVSGARWDQPGRRRA